MDNKNTQINYSFNLLIISQVTPRTGSKAYTLNLDNGQTPRKVESRKHSQGLDHENSLIYNANIGDLANVTTIINLSPLPLTLLPVFVIEILCKLLYYFPKFQSIR